VIKIDVNKALKQIFAFVIAYFRPSLAKFIIWPLLLTGLGFLNPPLWVEIVNWLLVNQNVFSQHQIPLSEPNGVWGWSLILFSIFIYCFETVAQVIKSRNENVDDLSKYIKEVPTRTADEVVVKLNETGFTASHLQDEKILKLINEISQLRYFGAFPKKEKINQLANSILDGELKGGTSLVKSRTLALLARYLCFSDNLEVAEVYLSESSKLIETKETVVADVFVQADKKNNLDSLARFTQEQSSLHYSSIFMLRRTKEGVTEAIKWLDNAQLNIVSLDTDGQIALISALLETEQWERALKEVYKLQKIADINSPALAQVVAFTFLSNSIKAVELRKFVMQQIPFSAESFPLSDDAKSVRLRNEAVTMFKLCAELARKLGAFEVSQASEKFALWLELRNPDTFQIAEGKLNNYLSDASHKALEYLPLAFAFKINLDYSKVEEEVNRQTALSNDTSPTLGVARFVLALNQKGSSQVIEYINDHREQLVKHVNPAAIKMLEVEVLAKAGLTEDAEALLSKWDQDGAIPEEIKNLRNIIASVKGEEPIALALSQYNDTNNVSDLAQLVNLLERSGLKEKCLFYTLKLFGITGTEQDALRVANASSANRQFTELHKFLVDNFDLVKNSTSLMFHWAWSLFREGYFSKSKECLLELKKLNDQHLDLQSLDAHLAIYTGNWDSLTVIIESSWENRNSLSAEDLMQVAQLAKAVYPSRAKEILEYTTSKFPDDPKVLASAYFTATALGWEDKKHTGDWLNKAAMLSNEEGPLHMTTFDELKNDSVYKAYDECTAPIFVIANLLNRTFSDFYLIQPIANLKNTDIRKKSFIGAFHSTRQEQVIIGKVVSVDASSLLILGQLNLLEQLFKAFTQIILPHSLMRWLFDEKQKIAFHQPSQIQKAKEVEALVTDGVIKIIEPSVVKKSNLALDVGEELAFLLEHANDNSCVDKQILVICSYPVYKVGGLREQIIELAEYYKNLSSCIALVTKLKDIEVITEDEYEKALSYLVQREQEWPSNPVIDDKATIYLDSLSLTYLMTVGVLEKFRNTGFNVFIHRSEFDNFKKLRTFDSTISEADTKLEQIRKDIFRGIQSGKVVFSSMQVSELDTENDKANQPTEELLQASTKSDVALIDDRYLNQHAKIAFDQKNIPIFTSLDFIETLYDNQIIAEKEKFSYRAKLRESGFGLIPITIEELNYHLDKSSINNGIVRPTKELKLIKENLSLLKINRLIKLPRDANWLHASLRNLSNALKSQWSENVAVEVSCARATWLYGLIDFRGWSHCLEIRHEEGMAYIGEMIRANTLLIAPEELAGDLKVKYYAWLEDIVLLPLKNKDPTSYESLVKSIKAQIEKLASNSLLEGGANE
jgi:hypothetical protein